MISELHIHTSELVREAAEGGVIVMERRGEPVAELFPIRRHCAGTTWFLGRPVRNLPDEVEFWPEAGYDAV